MMHPTRKRGGYPPSPILVSCLLEVPRNKLERGLWLSRNEDELGGRYKTAIEQLVERASALLAELPPGPGGEEWSIELRERRIILRNTFRENYHWNGGVPVEVQFS